MIQKIVKKRWVVVIGGILAATGFLYLGLVNYTEPTEVGIARNLFSGKMWLQKDGGWHLTLPWVQVACVDARPIRVAITSSGRGYSAKLIRFDPQYWEEFVQVEGFRYYWWANRLSFNSGYNEEYRGVRDIFRGHAYGVKDYKFLEVLEEYQTK